MCAFEQLLVASISDDVGWRNTSLQRKDVRYKSYRYLGISRLIEMVPDLISMEDGNISYL